MDLGEKPQQLSLDEIQKLDPANRTDYLALRRMFESDGWALFMQWLAMQANTFMQRQLIATKWDDVLPARGGKAMCDTVACIETITEATYRGILDHTDLDEPSETTIE